MGICKGHNLDGSKCLNLAKVKGMCKVHHGRHCLAKQGNRARCTYKARVGKLTCGVHAHLEASIKRSIPPKRAVKVHKKVIVQKKKKVVRFVPEPTPKKVAYFIQRADDPCNTGRIVYMYE